MPEYKCRFCHHKINIVMIFLEHRTLDWNTDATSQKDNTVLQYKHHIKLHPRPPPPFFLLPILCVCFCWLFEFMNLQVTVIWIYMYITKRSVFRILLRLWLYTAYTPSKWSVQLLEHSVQVSFRPSFFWHFVLVILNISISIISFIIWKSVLAHNFWSKIGAIYLISCLEHTTQFLSEESLSDRC